MYVRACVTCSFYLQSSSSSSVNISMKCVELTLRVAVEKDQCGKQEFPVFLFKIENSPYSNKMSQNKSYALLFHISAMLLSKLATNNKQTSKLHLCLH